MSESQYGDFRKRREQTVWHSLNRVVATLIVFAVIILVLCAFLPLLKQQRDLSENARNLKADIEKKKAVVARSVREEDLLRNDPAYVETIARDRLDLMKEGETVLRLDPPPVVPDKSNFKRQER